MAGMRSRSGLQSGFGGLEEKRTAGQDIGYNKRRKSGGVFDSFTASAKSSADNLPVHFNDAVFRIGNILSFGGAGVLFHYNFGALSDVGDFADADYEF